VPDGNPAEGQPGALSVRSCLPGKHNTVWEGQTMRALFAVGTLLLVSVVASAQTTQVVVRGAGTSSCADFAKLYKQAPKTAEDLFVSWAFGYWSGINVQLLNEHKPLRNVAGSYESMSLFLRTECDRRPLVPFVTIVNDHFTSAPQLPNPKAK
jgi:hypothetical protein